MPSLICAYNMYHSEEWDLEELFNIHIHKIQSFLPAIILYIITKNSVADLLKGKMIYQTLRNQMHYNRHDVI